MRSKHPDRGWVAVAIVFWILAAAYACFGQATQPATQPTTAPSTSQPASVRGAVGQNLSYLKSYSGRVLIDAAKQAEVPQMTPQGLRVEVITKGDDKTNGVYTVVSDEPFTAKPTGSPARFVSPTQIEIAAGPGQTPQLHLLFTDGRTELPKGFRLIRPGYTVADADAQAFTTEFIALLARLNTGVIRSMDWQRTNGSDVTTWDSRCKPTDAAWGMKGRGGPIEPVIGLCNRLGADLWFNVPAKADDDYVRQAARLIRLTLGTGQCVFVEYSNELWNNAAGFPQGEWCRAQSDVDPAAWALFPRTEQRTQRGRWYAAKRASEVAAIFADEFRGDRWRLVTMLAGCTADSGVLRDSLAFGWRPDAVATGGYFNGASADAARALWAGVQMQKFRDTAGDLQKLIYEWTDSGADPNDPANGPAIAAWGEGAFGSGIVAACHFVPLADPGSKYAATNDPGVFTPKCQALADLSAAHVLAPARNPLVVRLEQLEAERLKLRDTLNTLAEGIK